MRRIAVATGIAALVTLVGYTGYRAYGRSLPPLPAVVMHDAGVSALLEPPLDARFKQAVFGDAGDRVAGPKLIALTFDDGPYPVDTPVLLATLRDAHVPATFFLIGRDAEQYPGLVREIAAGGHEIANHTETHPNLDELDAAAVTAELAAGAATLGRLVPERDPAYAREFRPPHGRFTADTLVAAQHAGYDTILWTDDPGDWRSVSRTVLADHIARFATSPEIVLLHNGRPETVAMLPDVIQRFRNAGYTFVTVTELLRRAGPDALNHAARTPLPPENT
jgi:peptidoglycan/xylan/chitin deacetylase (PgdA/CDA1 family)